VWGSRDTANRRGWLRRIHQKRRSLGSSHTRWPFTPQEVEKEHRGTRMVNLWWAEGLVVVADPQSRGLYRLPTQWCPLGDTRRQGAPHPRPELNNERACLVGLTGTSKKQNVNMRPGLAIMRSRLSRRRSSVGQGRAIYATKSHQCHEKPHYWQALEVWKSSAAQEKGVK
jgi:hypothetical protein